MSQYAAETTVSVEKSRAEIEAIIRRYGAEEFASGWEIGRALIAFVIRGRRLKFVLPLPDKSSKQFLEFKRRNSNTVYKRTPEAAQREWEQACRQRWRALSLCIKAKLEAVESGIASFEQEMMPYFVMENGQTIAEAFLPHLGEIISGDYMRALPAPEEGQ